MSKNFFGRHARGLVFSVVAAAVPVLFSACKNSDFVPVSADGQVSVTEVKIGEGTSLSIISGEAKQLTVEILPENASDKEVLWGSSADDIATITAEGLLTAEGVGSAIITVSTKDGNKTARLQVTVKPVPVSEVKIAEGESLTLNVGESKRLTAEVLPAKAADKEVSWSSNAPKIATITAEGLLTAEDVGDAIITVTTRDGNHTATLNITVTAAPAVVVPVTGIRILERASLTLNTGGTRQLTSEVLPTNASDTGVIWSSSDGSVASVDGNGLVTAKGPGNATITVTTRDGNKTTSVIVDVLDYVLISTEQELRDISNNLGGKYRLANDITLTQEWEPLETFTGTLDGAGFIIRNFSIKSKNVYSRNAYYIGFIAVNNGTVKNIGVEVGVTGITANSSNADRPNNNSVGALVGKNEGYVSGIAIGSGEIKGSDISNVGGLVGENNGTVIGYSEVKVNSTTYGGGLVGLVNSGSSLVVGYTNGNVYANNEAGGLIGRSETGNPVIGYAVGAVSGEDSVGGLFGRIGLTWAKLPPSSLINSAGYARGSATQTESRRYAAWSIREVGQTVGYTSNKSQPSLYHSGKSGESQVSVATRSSGKQSNKSTGVTVTASTTKSDFSGLKFGAAVGEWTFYQGKWPSINFPADQSIFNNYRGDKQPIDP